jgi:predicted  nucleic acid-binding Zn-ribbon protein
MSFLKLSWCQLIRIILAQIGGNPLQQMYSQLNQGMSTMAPRSGLIPNELREIKQLIDQVTDKLNDASALAGDLTNIVDAMTNEFFQNPIAGPANIASTAIQARITNLDAQISALDPGSPTYATDLAALEAEKTALNDTANSLNTFVANTNRL